MARKNILSKYQILTAQGMTTDFSSAVTCIQFLDNVAMQVNWTGTGTGTFTIQGSADYEQDAYGNVLDAGNWISLSATAAATGSASSALFDLNQLSFPWIKMIYTTTLAESGSITAVPDVTGSLNNTYFLIDGVDGTNWYVWFNINSAGVDPAIANRTGIAVAAATDATANTLGGLIRTALASCTSITTIAGSNAVATFVQDTAGHGALTDGAVPTLFTLSYTVATGSTDGFISAKAVGS